MSQSRQKLSQEEIESRLASLDGWELEEGKLHREFKFENFIDAFTFMTSLGFVAERINHHPEWKNVYNTVSIDLQTHDADGISILDFELAAAANMYYGG